MTKNSKQDQSKDTFFSFLTNAEQRKDWYIISIAFAVIFFLIRYCYPTLIHCQTDSSGYVSAALNHIKISYRPYGYPIFLNFIHQFNASEGFLFFSQYFIYWLSLVLFYFTIKYFFTLTGVLSYVLLAALILSPVSLYYTAYTISDCIFIAVTILWIVNCIWLVYYQKMWLVILNLILALFAIHIRYAGLIYPMVASVLLLLVFQKQKKLLAIVPLVTLFIYVKVTVSAVKEATGVETFSGFSGWSMANNAVTMLPYVTVDTSLMKDPEVKLANYYVSQYPPSSYAFDGLRSTSFIWSPKWAGKALLKAVIEHNQTEYFQSWLYTGTIWGKYGNFLVKHYPYEFARYFILRNTQEMLFPERVYLPPCRDQVSELLTNWYGGSPKSFSYNIDVMSQLALPIKIFNLLCWILVILSTALFAFMYKKIPFDSNQKKVLLIGFITIALYTGFIIFGHPFEQRYIINIHVLRVTLPLIILGALGQRYFKLSSSK